MDVPPSAVATLRDALLQTRSNYQTDGFSVLGAFAAEVVFVVARPLIAVCTCFICWCGESGIGSLLR